MPFQLSPGVNVVEKDFTSIVPAVSSSVGGFAGVFRWGPIEEPTRVSSENELVKIFGAPPADDAVVAQSFFTAANFLSYTNNMLVVRANAENSKNAVATASGGVVQSEVRLLSAGTGYTNTDNTDFTIALGGGSNAAFTIRTNVIGNTRHFASVRDASGTLVTNANPGAAAGDAFLVTAGGTGYTSQTGVALNYDGTATGITVDITVVGDAITRIALSSGSPTTFAVQTGALSVDFLDPQISGGAQPTANVLAFDNGASRTITGITVTSAGSGYTTGPTFEIFQAGTTIVQANRANGVVNAISPTVTGVRIKNSNDYIQNYSNGASAVGQFAARYAGVRGNGLRVFIVDRGSWVTSPQAGSLQEFAQNSFSAAPGTSTFANSKGISDDEMHILVLDSTDGTFSGVPGGFVILEKYEFVSKLSDARKSDGSSNYYKNVINNSSQYIWWLAHPYYNQVSNPVSSGSPLTTVATGTLTITSSTIAITGQTQALDDFVAFLNTTSKDRVGSATGRQIRLENTALNNRVFTVTTAVVNSGTYTFTVAETGLLAPLAETTGGTASIVSVAKHAWGTSSEAVIASPNARKMVLLSGAMNFTLSGGVSDTSTSEVANAFSIFADSESYDISLLATGNIPYEVAESVVATVAEVRKDCMVFISPNNGGEPITNPATAVTQIKAYRNASNINSSYAVMDSGWKYQYDRYNDIYRWVPLNGDIAGLCARTDFTADPWFSPGGFNRGVVKNIVKLGFNPKQGERDSLYVAGINPVVSFPGQGVVLFGDKTMLSKPSAFDRINVRRLFIVLEKSIAIAARFQLFEFNDEFTRAQFKNIVEPFLRDVQGRRGVVDFRVKCDGTNNTGDVIDRNEFVADIFIKPNRSINFITLNFVAARSAVNFEEIGA